jgi:hypothetical protein
MLFSHPVGDLGASGQGPIAGGVLEEIIQRGLLRCGVVLEPGFSESMDEEFCRALSASLFGVNSAVEYFQLSDDGESFNTLAKQRKG